jgi:hypothetical protein
VTPISQPGHEGSWMSGITSPIANRLKNAAINAVFLSGNDIGNIKETSSAPKMSPQTRPERSGVTKRLHSLLTQWSRIYAASVRRASAIRWSRCPLPLFSGDDLRTVWRTPMLVSRPMGTSVDAFADDLRFRPGRLGRQTLSRISAVESGTPSPARLVA